MKPPKRLFLVGAIASSLVVASIPVAHAAGPRAGCPPAFQGPLTFEQIIQMFPPPPDVDPEPQFAHIDQNGDRKLCLMVAPEPAPGPINLIDNVAAT
jgi:hypothetical protein